MLRITRLSDYAIVVLAAAARGVGIEFTARSAAEETKLPLPAVKKILKSLVRSGIVVSQRGIAGGYRLGRAATQIALADIIDAVEGPFALTECGQGDRRGAANSGDAESRATSTRELAVPAELRECCEYEDNCAVQANWSRVNGIVRRALASVTLADMIGPGDRELVALRVKRPRRAEKTGEIAQPQPENRRPGTNFESAAITIEQGKSL